MLSLFLRVSSRPFADQKQFSRSPCPQTTDVGPQDTRLHNPVTIAAAANHLNCIPAPIPVRTGATPSSQTAQPFQVSQKQTH